LAWTSRRSYVPSRNVYSAISFKEHVAETVERNTGLSKSVSISLD
jgi:hypothetical protein